MFIIHVYSSSSSKQCTLFEHGVTSVRSQPHIKRGNTSAVYFMYKFNAFKLDPVNKLDKPGMEKAKIHTHNTKQVILDNSGTRASGGACCILNFDA